ncbi:MAG TPA: PPOX class F420-dependent oxidoreductase [Miltoncostaeaceae bacterium]|nr:PPOX class F420-dependent oxidoreductase [Miltoncostaeaceae bacterium]
MATLSDDERAIVTGGNLAHFTTLQRDGMPQTTPVWIDLHPDGHILVNTAEGRAKLKHVRRDPRVAISVSSRESDFRAVWLRGRVVETTHDGAEDHIHAMAKRYLGQDRYPFLQPGEQRVLIHIAPEKIESMIM